ncbi:hypothetical protein [Streptodolium elevatio]
MTERMDDAARVHPAARTDVRIDARPDFTGDFETHVTVSAAGPATDTRLREWAARNGAKYTRILLDAGRVPDQPMLTLRGRGTLTTQRAAVAAHTADLRRAGFDVVRVKIEAAPSNQGVPRTSGEAKTLPPDCYFEHHVKLVLTTHADIGQVTAIAVRHSARVSRNARRLRPDAGGHERFVTQRCHGVGRPEAHSRLRLLRDALAEAGLQVVEIEQEFVVHDDNPAVDAGWFGAVGGAV